MVQPDIAPHGPEGIHLLLAEQLADYRAMLHLAQEDTAALTAQRFDALHDSQAQRERLAQRILTRQQTLQAIGNGQQSTCQELLADIAATIEAILTLDRHHQRLLTAQHETMASLLQQLQQGRMALHQYKPPQENLPHFLNHTV